MRWIIAALGLLASTAASADVPDTRISIDDEWFDDRREISDKASLEDERAAAEYTSQMGHLLTRRPFRKIQLHPSAPLFEVVGNLAGGQVDGAWG